jgi:hypothetical protein
VAVTACGGGGDGSGLYTPAIGTNTFAVVASGAPLVNVPYTITKLDGTAVQAGIVANDASLSASLTASDAPFLIQVTDTGVTPNMTYSNLLLAGDFDNNGQARLNVTPLSTIVTKIIQQTSSPTLKTTAELERLRSRAADAVKEAIQPLLDQAGVTDVSTGKEMLTKVFMPISDPLDKVLDALTVSCSTTACTLTPNNAQAKDALGSTLQITTTSIDAAQISAALVNASLRTNSATLTNMLSTSPVVVVVSADTSWGTATDSWAGYSGKIAIYNFTDSAINGGTELYFESAKLQSSGFYNATVVGDSGKFLFKLPDWSGMAPKQGTRMPKPFTFGFSGKGMLSTVTDLGACNIGGKKCLILIDDEKLNLNASANTSVAVRSWNNFIATVPKSTVATPTTTVPVPTTKPNTASETKGGDDVASSNNAAGTSRSSSNLAAVIMKNTRRWLGGFNGGLEIQNTGSTAWQSWSVTFNCPASVTAISTWGNYKLSATACPSVTFSNETWNGAVAAGRSVAFGFGGTGSLSNSDSISNCTISIDGATAVACNTSVSETNNSSVSTTPTTPIAPPTTTTALSDSAGATSGSDEPTTVNSSVIASQTGRVFVGYYPSWYDNWFSAKDWAGNNLSNDQILARSKMAKIPGTYTHLIVAFAQPNLTYSTAANFDKNVWTGTGLEFTSGPQDIKRAVDVLHARGIKVLLAVGGATYHNWAGLAGENGNASGRVTNDLKQLMVDIGFDGLDVDYEVSGITTTQYSGAINAMRKAVDLAGNGRMLSLAGWSTGADCTTATTTLACGDATSYWGGRAGGERLVFSQPGMAAKIDMLNVMSYDAQTNFYDGVNAWQAYRDLFAATTIVNIGLQTAPEGWAGGMLVVNDADGKAACAGSMISKNQYQVAVNKPYSVERYVNAVKAIRSNSNRRDGAMLWEVLKTTSPTTSCNLASPQTIVQRISTDYNLPLDDRAAWK